MESWVWVLVACVIIVAIAFVVLVAYLAVLLVSLKRTINTADHICHDLQGKVNAFDPYFQMIEQIGTAVEKKAGHVAQAIGESEGGLKGDKYLGAAMAVTNLALVGLSVWQKLKRRK
jgi:uncharacterized protein YoxC